MRYKKERVALDIVCFLIAACGIILVNKDFRIFAICVLPFLLNHIIQGILFAETSMSGAPGIIKRDEKPLLFNFIIIVFVILLTLDLLYLFFIFLLW
jgi:hypothetical protein